MLKQVDFAELIAYMAKQAPTDQIVIEISKVRELGHELEQKSSMIVFDGDKYSIESFRRLCPKKIKVTHTEIIFDKQDASMKQIIARYQPSSDILSYLRVIGKKE